MNWPFCDPPNTAVYTSKAIARGQDWIAYVTHDADDGAWQFHGPAPTAEADASILSLEEIVCLDEGIAGLAGLPVGWCAWRVSVSENWQRAVRA